MSNYQVEPVDQPKALTREAIKALRNEQVQGLSRRQMLRRSVGGAVLLWLGEVSLGTVGFLWPNLSGGFGAKVKIGTYNDIKVTFHIDADASREDIEALVAQSQKRSAVYDALTNPTNVTVEVA